MPSNITTLREYVKWFESLYVAPVGDVGEVTPTVQMKRRTNFHPFAMTTKKNHWTQEEDPTTVQYLIDDSVSRGEAKVKNFNKIFNFFTEEYVKE